MKKRYIKIDRNYIGNRSASWIFWFNKQTMRLTLTEYSESIEDSVWQVKYDWTCPNSSICEKDNVPLPEEVKQDALREFIGQISVGVID